MLRLLPLLALLAAAPEPAAPLLSPDRIKADVRTLSSDAFRGRGPAQPGEATTLDFLERRFAELGLKPAAPGGYRQPVPLIRYTPVRAEFTLTQRGRATPLRPGVEISAATPGDGVSAFDAAAVVFVGYGVVEPKLGYDPYAGVDVKGKVVVALAGDPDVEAGRDLGFGGRASSPAARTKAAEARRRGAVAFLTIHEPFPASYPWLQRANGDRVPLFTLGDGPVAPAGMVAGNLRQDVGESLLKGAGLDYRGLKRAAERADFRARQLGGTTLSARVEMRGERVRSHNVVAVLPGTDRAAGSVFYGAHWDAYGENAFDPPADRIRNGAVDNATGTATLLEIARAFAAGPRPRRTVVFAAWTAEEKGLLGAEWYAAHPLLPLATTAAQFNLDPHVVPGRTRDLELIGAGRTPLEGDLVRVAAAQGLAVTPEENTEAGWYFRSDHYAFAQRGVPGVYFRAGRDLVAGGKAAGEAKRAAYNDRCYHQTCDEFDPAWDFTGTAQEGSVAYALGREIAEGRRWPRWAASEPFAVERAKTSDARR